MTTAKKPARKIDTVQLLDLTQKLRDLGVEEFEFEGLKVRFDPTLRQQLAFSTSGLPDLRELDKKQAMERFATANKDDDDLIDWST